MVPFVALDKGKGNETFQEITDFLLSNIKDTERTHIYAIPEGEKMIYRILLVEDDDELIEIIHTLVPAGALCQSDGLD